MLQIFNNITIKFEPNKLPDPTEKELNITSPNIHMLELALLLLKKSYG